MTVAKRPSPNSDWLRPAQQVAAAQIDGDCATDFQGVMQHQIARRGQP
jgi:hypothetical protein